MEKDRKVTFQQGEEFAKEHKMFFFETSAKDSINVQEAFATMTIEITDMKEIIKENDENGLKKKSEEYKKSIDEKEEELKKNKILTEDLYKKLIDEKEEELKKNKILIEELLKKNGELINENEQLNKINKQLNKELEKFKNEKI